MAKKNNLAEQIRNMKVETRKIEELLPYAKNSRTHSDFQVNQIASSIKEFGFTNPVLITTDGEIIAGHGRVLAAMRLRMDEVPCITLGHLTDTQRRAYVIADNQLALNAGWDYEMLNTELDFLREESFNLDLLGFPSLDFENKDEEEMSTEVEEESESKKEFLIIIECLDEMEQREQYERLTTEGVKCKII